MSKFTKGPWQVISTSSEGYNLIKDYSGQQIADVWRFVPTRPEAIANANLIANAPCMFKELEAIKSICLQTTDPGELNNLRDLIERRIDKVLKKARGE